MNKLDHNCASTQPLCTCTDSMCSIRWRSFTGTLSQ